MKKPDGKVVLVSSDPVLQAEMAEVLKQAGYKVAVSGGDLEASPVRTVADLQVDKETYLVHYKGKAFDFPKKEFELLYLLASSPEKVFSRKEIFRVVWNKELSQKGARTIDVHIRKLREKLFGLNIMTIKGVGYKLSTRTALSA